MHYEYDAELVKVVDGDTVDLNLDLGFYMRASLRFRIVGMDTPELRGGTPETKAAAKVARDYVYDKLSKASRITVRTSKADSFGRWLADLTYYDETFSHNLGKEMIDLGLAVVWTK